MRPDTLRGLKAEGYKPRTVKEELRDNLIAKIKAGAELFPGIVGYDKTVVPQLENALLSRHDFILLGLRGQAKTRILRQLKSFLDEALPVVAGCEIHDDPTAPICATCRKLAREMGDELPVAWIGRDARYNEKLATPDVSIADLIGDIDPIKAATKKLAFADEEVIHYGLVPRTNRGIFAINELPDLQPRIQVGLLNILEEKDVQIEHEASVSKIGEEQLFYLQSRGLSEAEASSMIVSGFIEPLVKELPMEYAVEMNRLIELQMEGSVG